MPAAPESPSPRALAQAAELAGRSAAVAAIRRLAGGTHARTWLLETVNPRREMVLREYPEADDAAAREARVLTMLDGLGGLAPRLLAADADGTWSGRPSVLISRLPGQADITPADPRRWAAQLGTALAWIHRAPLRSLAGLPDVISRPGGSPGHVAGPAAAIVAAAWPRLARAPRVLTHFDFWSGNTVWEHAALSGVVDWSGAAAGPAGFDVGWCRLDLYLLFGEDIADEFLDAYRAAATTALPDAALHDLWAVARSHDGVEDWVPNYRDLGRGDLTAAQLRSRHAAWTSRLVQAWG